MWRISNCYFKKTLYNAVYRLVLRHQVQAQNRGILNSLLSRPGMIQTHQRSWNIEYIRARFVTRFARLVKLLSQFHVRIERHREIQMTAAYRTDDEEIKIQFLIWYAGYPIDAIGTHTSQFLPIRDDDLRSTFVQWVGKLSFTTTRRSLRTTQS